MAGAYSRCTARRIGLTQIGVMTPFSSLLDLQACRPALAGCRSSPSFTYELDLSSVLAGDLICRPVLCLVHFGVIWLE